MINKTNLLEEYVTFVDNTTKQKTYYFETVMVFCYYFIFVFILSPI